MRSMVWEYFAHASISHRVVAWVGCAALAFALSACQPIMPAPDGSGAAAPVEAAAHFEIKDGAVTGPASVPAGLTSLVISNSGSSPHALEIGWMAEGVTVEQLLSAPPTGIPDKVGTVTVVFLQPGDQIEAVVDFGAHPAYVIKENFVPDPSYVAFAADETMAPNEAPAADVNVDLVNFAYVMPDQIQAGPRWWHVNNEGTQTHEIAIHALKDGLTLEALQEQLTAVDAEAQVPPPPTEIPSWAVGIGQSDYVMWDLPAGQYVVVCNVPDFSTDPWGPDHWHKGMFKEITVAP